MIYGYARVSTDGQSVAAQVAALRAACAGKVFREVASGAKTDRAQLRKAITALEAGDVFMVTRLDRLARSTCDLLNTLAAITAQQGWLPVPSTCPSASTRSLPRPRRAAPRGAICRILPCLVRSGIGNVEGCMAYSQSVLAPLRAVYLR
jgi:hypothetical protein